MWLRLFVVFSLHAVVVALFLLLLLSALLLLLLPYDFSIGTPPPPLCPVATRTKASLEAGLILCALKSN